MKKDGGHAFPHNITAMDREPRGKHYHLSGYDGMTLRDYFAGQALPAWIQALTTRSTELGYTDGYAAHEAARLSRISADAMLAEGDKEEA